jgi:excisionase family DNA binding protein
MKTWFTVTEGAEYAGVSRDTIYTACERGELRHARIGGGATLISASGNCACSVPTGRATSRPRKADGCATCR